VPSSPWQNGFCRAVDLVVVVADFLFTATALVAQPITGIALARQDLSGVENVEEADGLLSECLQHEVDQLDGIFWIYLG
jgi:uncharacterized membrane protein